MPQNLIASLGQAISQLLSTNGSILQATGLDIFRGLATILLAWFGIKAALSASQGHGGFHFAKFADLILMISFGLGMLTYYSTPIPGMGYSFSDLITKEALSLSGQIESDHPARHLPHRHQLRNFGRDANRHRTALYSCLFCRSEPS